MTHFKTLPSLTLALILVMSGATIGHEGGLTDKVRAAIDCAHSAGVSLEFQRWLGVQRAPSDCASILLSRDGDNWTTIWENDSTRDVKDYA